MNQDDKAKLYNQFNRIHSQFAVIKKKLTEGDCDSRLFPSEMQVLCLVNTNPKISVTEIASNLYITKRAASQLVKKLCSKGILKKYRSEENERTVLLTSTDKGRAAVEKFFQNESGAFVELENVFSTISDRDLETIQSFFDALEKMFVRKLQ
jgi:DNA-binding MarR family transcriptional regulator